MKKITTGLLFGFVIASSLFASSQDALKKDISKIFTHGRLSVKSINIIAQDRASDLKNLNVAIGNIKGNPKPFLLLYNKDTIIMGSVIDRKSGKTVFGKFIAKNRDKIKAALSKAKQKEKKNEVENNKASISLLNGKFKELAFKIKGKNPKGRTIYLITDPNCPFCKQYERNQLPNTIKNSKEVIIVPLFLNIPGHETSAMRSSWLLEQYKKDKSANMLELLHKASNSKDNSYKEVDKEFANKKIALMKKFLSKGTVRGTPTLFYKNGNPAR